MGAPLDAVEWVLLISLREIHRRGKHEDKLVFVRVKPLETVRVLPRIGGATTAPSIYSLGAVRGSGCAAPGSSTCLAVKVLRESSS